MTTLMGIQTMLSKALPTGVDSARVLQWQLQSGKTYAQLATELSQALMAKQQELINKWGWLFFITNDMMMEYMDGGTISPAEELPDTERGKPESYTTIGHMINLIPYGTAIGGTKRFYRDAREAQINAQIRKAVHRNEWRLEDTLFKRIFTDAENAIGTSGYDVGWVTDAGNVLYTPPGYDGATFASHTHYLGVDSDTEGFDHMLNDLATTLHQHGHEPPFEAMVSLTDISSYKALADYVLPVGNTPVVVIDQAGATSTNYFFSREGMGVGASIGGYLSERGYVNLRGYNLVTAGYAAMLKSYGQLDPRNPLAVRVHPSMGFGMYAVPETTADTEYPLKQIDIEFEFGLSCGMDRTAGAVAYRSAAGTWTDMTVGSEADA